MPLERFFDSLPTDSGIAFLVIQHLDPTHESAMVDILGRNASIGISEAVDGQSLGANHAYLIPPNTSLTIEEARLALQPPTLRDGLRMPIDVCLESLARNQTLARAAIILSGSGSDGTQGVRILKASGGFILAQTAASAEHAEMPANAIATGLVDCISEPERLPAELMRLFDLPWSAPGKHPGLGVAEDDVSQADSIEPQLLERILRRVKAISGDDFTFNKAGTLVRRIRRRIGMNQLSAIADYVALVERSDDEARLLRDDLLIGVTSFFRDPRDFKRLESAVIAPLVARTPTDETLRIWIVGCATGQEAYSVAMLVVEQLEAQNKHNPVRIFASDVNEPALSVASAGTYAASMVTDVSDARLQRFFTRQDGHYTANSTLKDCLTFTRQNLVGEPPFSRLDLICCRNLLIYLQPEVQHRTIALFHFALRRQGCLFLGHAETIGKHDDLFAPLDRSACLYQRTDRAVNYAAAFPERTIQQRGEVSRLPLAPARSRASRVGERVRLHLLDQYAPAAVVVDDQGQIVHFSGHTGPYLNQPSGTPTRHLLTLARPELKAGLRHCLKQLTLPGNDGTCASQAIEGQADLPTVRIVARQFNLPVETDSLVIVIFEPVDTSSPTASVQRPEAGIEAAGHLRLLEMELKATQDELATITEHHDWSIEDLKAANEEIRSVNEEFQSTNEELETSKEELQSMNEELSTVNAQLRQSVVELRATNDDLNNLLSSTDIATLFLDTSLCVARYTSTTLALFSLINADIGRPLFDIRQKFEDTALYDDATRVLATSVAREAEVHAGDGRIYLRRILPYFREDASVGGIVITFVDISARKTADLQAIRLAAIVRDSADAITVIDLQGRFIEWNQGAERLFGWTENQARVKDIQSITPADAMEPMHRMLDDMQSGLVRTVSFESTRTSRRGGLLDVWLTATALTNVNEQVYAVALTDRDITPIKRTESQLREADRRKNEFMAMVAHELRNPLAAMASSIEVMQLCHDDPTALEHASEVVDRQFDKLTRLTDDLLDVSRITRGHVTLRSTRVDVTDALRRAIDEVQPAMNEAGHQLIVDLDPALPAVNGDIDRLSQVFSNLLFNAVKYTPDPGHLQVNAYRQENTNRIEFTDDGLGLDAGAMSRIFDMFEQAGRTSRAGFEGLGIGLSLSRWLVESHGGTLEVFSEGSDSGSTFVVTLPIADENPTEPDGSAGVASRTKDIASKGIEGGGQRSKGSSNSKTEDPGISLDTAGPSGHDTILVVDDNEDAAMSLERVLQALGHTTFSAFSGEQALLKMHELQPRIVFVDIGLPDMSGLELARRLRATRPGAAARIIALTGFGSGEDHDSSLRAGFDDHLVKPARLSTLKELLGRRAG